RAMAEEMAMPGGWTMSMAWMPMPGETRLAAAAGFLAMWVAMMGAMMIPSLVPTLTRDRSALESPGPAPDRLAALGGAGGVGAGDQPGGRLRPLLRPVHDSIGGHGNDEPGDDCADGARYHRGTRGPRAGAGGPSRGTSRDRGRGIGDRSSGVGGRGP